MTVNRAIGAVPRSCGSLLIAVGAGHGWAEWSGGLAVLPAMLLSFSTREEVYNILWVLVFGFATLNILSLGARQFEEEKKGLSFGEIVAVMVVVVSMVLLGWEMLYLFHVLPIRLTPR